MPEVAGDAAILVDPFNVNQIAAAMVEVWKDKGVRLTLQYLGRRNLRRFSWDSSAENLWQSIQKACAQLNLPA